MRYGHKLWVDLNTGMLLMTRTYDDKHEVVEQFAFSQLQIGGNINPEKVKPRFSTGGGRDWRMEDSAAVQADLGKAGWTIRLQPPGFRIVTQLTRSLGENRVWARSSYRTVLSRCRYSSNRWPTWRRVRD